MLSPIGEVITAERKALGIRVVQAPIHALKKIADGV